MQAAGPEPLQYRPPAVRAAAPATAVVPIICLSLALFTLFTCLRIEILNARAGHVLPRTEVGKWRVAKRAAAASIAASQPIESAQISQNRADVDRRAAEATLRDVVGRWGLLQYPLVLIGSVMSVGFAFASRPRSHRLIAVASALVTVFCGAAMIYRDYYGSLGW